MQTCYSCQHCVRGEFPVDSDGHATGKRPAAKCHHPDTGFIDRVSGEIHRWHCKDLRYGDPLSVNLTRAQQRCGGDECAYWMPKEA